MRNLEGALFLAAGLATPVGLSLLSIGTFANGNQAYEAFVAGEWVTFAGVLCLVAASITGMLSNKK